jgi:hypothetical protein
LAGGALIVYERPIVDNRDINAPALRISVIVVLTGLSAISLTQFDAPHAKLYRRGHVPAAWLGLPFRPITLEEDNATGRIEVAEHRCR